MQASDIPGKFNIPFANAAGGGYIRAIPQASQIGITDGAASLTDGFVPLNFLAVGAGGIPPFGQDFNGLLKQITQWVRWTSGGGPTFYDSSFSTAIGGYPSGAFLQQAANQGQFWISTADNNTSNPDAGGANWLAFPSADISIVGRTQIFTSSGTFTVPANVTQVEVYGVGAGGAGGASGDGSGGGTVGNVGAGGGAGAFGYKRVFSLTPGGTVAVTIGAGGVANIPAGNGGSSSFGAALTLAGGGGGSSGISTLGSGGAGGSATGADYTVKGGDGGFSGPNVGTVTLSDAERMYSRGGIPGGGWGTTSWSGTGNPGQGYGAGGGGSSGGSLLLGGNGAPGILIVRW